jgi:predicted transcriptional regulator
MPEASESISFRLPGTIAGQLDEAARVRGLSRSQYLRSVVIDTLTRGDAEAPGGQLTNLENAIDRLGRNLVHKFAVATGALLSDMNQPPDRRDWLTAEQINAWIQKNLLD